MYVHLHAAGEAEFQLKYLYKTENGEFVGAVDAT